MGRMTIKQLEKMASDNKINVEDFNTKTLESFSMPGVIVLNRKKLKNSIKRKMRLAHELGHCMTGSFYNIKSKYETRERMEYRADKWTIENLIPSNEFIYALKKGICQRWELAEYFSVTEAYIDMAAKIYEEQILNLKTEEKF